MRTNQDKSVEAVKLDILLDAMELDRDWVNSLDDKEVLLEPDFSPNHTEALRLFGSTQWQKMTSDEALFNLFKDLYYGEDAYTERDALFYAVLGVEAKSPQEIEEFLFQSDPADKRRKLAEAMTNAIVAGMDADVDNNGQIILYTGLERTDEGGYDIYEADLH